MIKKLLNKKEKSQVFVYIILGVVVVTILLIFLLLMNNTDLKLFLLNSKHPVPHYVEECMKFEIVDAVEILSSQGGFIYEYQPNLTTTKRIFAYSIYPDNSMNALKNTAPTYEFMELEIARYIEENIDNCIDKMDRYSFDKARLPKSKVKINPESIYAELDYPLRIYQEEREYEFKEFSTKHEIPFGRMIELRDIVISDLITYPNLMLLDKLYDTDFEMYINPYSGKIKVIDMVNTSHRLRNDPLKFSFAIKDLHTLPAELYFEEKIPDTIIHVGERKILNAKCNHQCKFYDDTIMFEINEDSGFIEYKPTRLDIGEYNITITIDDDTYKVMDTFNLKVLG